MKKKGSEYRDLLKVFKEKIDPETTGKAIKSIKSPRDEKYLSQQTGIWTR